MSYFNLYFRVSSAIVIMGCILTQTFIYFLSGFRASCILNRSRKQTIMHYWCADDKNIVSQCVPNISCIDTSDNSDNVKTCLRKWTWKTWSVLINAQEFSVEMNIDFTCKSLNQIQSNQRYIITFTTDYLFNLPIGSRKKHSL